MIYLYKTFLYQPIFNLLIFLYNIVPLKDLGIAIILLTILVKLLLYPLTKKSLKSQKDLQKLQPKLDELKKKYSNDKEKLAQEMLNLYRQQKVNPMSSCLPVLIQFPFIIALYQALRAGLSSHFDLLYNFIQVPQHLNTMFFNVLDLNKPQFSLALLAAIAQYIQTKMLATKQPPKPIQHKEGAKDENMLALMNKNMMVTMPIITFVIGVSLPGGLTLYWLVTNIITIFQQFSLYRNDNEAENFFNKEEMNNKEMDDKNKSENKVIEGEIIEE